jgi:hemerythrin-like domain-containing protein
METLVRLRREHDVMVRLADVLANEATLFGSGDRGDLGLMRDVLRYLTEDPDRCHHPLEDLALWRLADRGFLGRTHAEGLDFEHRALRYHGATLVQMLNAAFADVALSRETIANAAAQYASSLRAHLESEERVLFPLMRAHLSPHDWEQIALASTALIGADRAALIEEHLRRLLASIAERTACSCAVASDAAQ